MKKNKEHSPEELIHVRLEASELLLAKREILNLELSLLKIVTVIKKYHDLRMLELSRKEILYKNIKQTSIKLRSLHKTLPKMNESSMSKHPSHGKMATLKNVKRVPSNQGIEAQLQEIQNKLDLLQD